MFVIKFSVNTTAFVMLISYVCVSVRVSCQVQARRLTTRQSKHSRLCKWNRGR